MTLLERPHRPAMALARLRGEGHGRGGPGGRPRAVRELALIVALFGVYKLGRLLASGRIAEAFGNARRVWDLERTLDLPSETAVQHGLLHSDLLVHAANGYYAYVHFPATAAFLLWIYLRRPSHYRWIRRVVVALTASGLVLHLLVPLAPPRMLTVTGLIDTGAAFGPAVYGAPQTDTMANQYAAMPSLHIGWAAVVALGLIATSRTRWRWLWTLHPVVTVLVVVATANHYWMDGVVVLVMTAVVVLLVRPVALPAGWLTTAAIGMGAVAGAVPPFAEARRGPGGGASRPGRAPGRGSAVSAPARRPGSRAAR
ncbi:phosphatase PAP2 family protein [Actinomadura roseirufa]|uniref:phosphatase PAP2 family protein n=1 Tax=Actinomadura roseirufa TaxID=2094049 RepID=UPI0010419D8C|nr:phosphatase PAP2 family protein [Actinomadura roseirufa]